MWSGYEIRVNPKNIYIYYVILDLGFGRTKELLSNFDSYFAASLWKGTKMLNVTPGTDT